MFGPKRTTSLDATEYRLIRAALDGEVSRLRAESERHRDAYDPAAWADTTAQGRLMHFLRNRLAGELQDLPVESEHEQRLERDRLRKWAGPIPRSKANAAAHHADVVKRRAAEEARRVAYWDRRGGRPGA